MNRAKKHITNFAIECKRGNFDSIQDMIENGFPPELISPNDVYWCIRHNLQSIIQLFSKHIDLSNPKFDTLNCACFYNKLEIAEFLLRTLNNMNINVSVYGKAAVCLSCSRGNIDVIKLLVSYNVDPLDFSEEYFQCPLEIATDQGYARIMIYLYYLYKRENREIPKRQLEKFESFSFKHFRSLYSLLSSFFCPIEELSPGTPFVSFVKNERFDFNLGLLISEYLL